MHSIYVCIGIIICLEKTRERERERERERGNDLQYCSNCWCIKPRFSPEIWWFTTKRTSQTSLVSLGVRHVSVSQYSKKYKKYQVGWIPIFFGSVTLSPHRFHPFLFFRWPTPSKWSRCRGWRLGSHVKLLIFWIHTTSIFVTIFWTKKSEKCHSRQLPWTSWPRMRGCCQKPANVCPGGVRGPVETGNSCVGALFRWPLWFNSRMGLWMSEAEQRSIDLYLMRVWKDRLRIRIVACCAIRIIYIYISKQKVDEFASCKVKMWHIVECFGCLRRRFFYTPNSGCSWSNGPDSKPEPVEWHPNQEGYPLASRRSRRIFSFQTFY